MVQFHFVKPQHWQAIAFIDHVFARSRKNQFFAPHNRRKLRPRRVHIGHVFQHQVCFAGSNGIYRPERSEFALCQVQICFVSWFAVQILLQLRQCFGVVTLSFQGIRKVQAGIWLNGSGIECFLVERSRIGKAVGEPVRFGGVIVESFGVDITFGRFVELSQSQVIFPHVVMTHSFFIGHHS